MAANRWKVHDAVHYDIETSVLTIYYKPVLTSSIPDISDLGAALNQYYEIATIVRFYIYEHPGVPWLTHLEKYAAHVERVKDIKMIVSWLNNFRAIKILDADLIVTSRTHRQVKLIAGLWALDLWDRTQITQSFDTVGIPERTVIKPRNGLPESYWLRYIFSNWLDALEFHANLDVEDRRFFGTWNREYCRAPGRNLPQEYLNDYQFLEDLNCGAEPELPVGFVNAVNRYF